MKMEIWFSAVVSMNLPEIEPEFKRDQPSIFHAQRMKEATIKHSE